MKRYLLRRMNSRGGFSLAEMLVTLLILLMVTGVVAAGVPMAANAYQKVVDSANAQVLLSTAMTTLRSELETAKDSILIKDDGDGVSVSYYSTETLYTTIKGGEGEDIYVNPYETVTTDAGGKITAYVINNTDSGKYNHPLVTAKASTDNLHVEFQHISYADGLFTVSGLMVVKTLGGERHILAGKADGSTTMYIRAVNVTGD